MGDADLMGCKARNSTFMLQWSHCKWSIRRCWIYPNKHIVNIETLMLGFIYLSFSLGKSVRIMENILILEIIVFKT